MAAVREPVREMSSAERRLRRRPRSKKWLWVGVLGLFAIGAYAAWAKSHANKGDQKLILAKVSRGDLVETVSATGSVTAQTGAEVKIGSQITGVIKRLYADVGTNVKKGQLIAELDLPDLQAQLQQAQSNLQQAQTRYAQQLSGVGQEKTQTATAVVQAQAAVFSAQQKVASAQASARQQQTATPSDIRRAETALASAKAALATAQATQAQVQAGADLNVETAQEQLQQAQANQANSSANLTRLKSLLAKGYESQADVDAAQATATVNQSLVRSATQNVALVKQKVTADLETAKQQVAQAQQGVASAQAALESAKAETYTTASRLADVKDAEATLNQSKAGLEAAKANIANDTLKQQDVKAAEEAVKTAEAQVAYNQAQVGKSFIRSPISGTVLQLASQQGETLAAGLSAPTLIIVADLNRLEIDAFVDETDIGKIHKGQMAACTIDAFPNETFQGTVAKIASGSTIQQSVVTYDVTISIKDPKHELKPDMTASVTIQTGKLSNVLLVPTVAVTVGSHGSTVDVTKKENGQQTTESIPVVTGGTDGVNTEIISGLTEGQEIVIAGANQNNRGFGPTSPFGPKQSNRNNKKGGGGG